MHQPQNKPFICVAVIGEIRTKSGLLSKADATFVKTRLPIHILFLFASHRYENDSEDYVENRNTVITKINAIRLNIEYIEVTIDKYATQQIIDVTFSSSKEKIYDVPMKFARKLIHAGQCYEPVEALQQ